MGRWGQQRVMISGGAGFLGSHLCERYLDKGWEVICVDNFHTGRKANIEHLRSHPDFEVMRHDITEPVMAEVDLILNFACPASPVHYQSNPIKTIKTRIDRYMTFKQSDRYIDRLQEFARGYNKTYHRTIDTKPELVTPR